MSPQPEVDGFDELTRYLVGDSTMQDALDRIARIAVEAIEPAAYAGVTMFVDGDVRTGAFTDPESPEIDQAQYDAGESPCLDSFRTGEVFRLTFTLEDGPWPAFRAACREHGILSTASFPMLVEDVPHGALNFYSHEVDAFGDDDVRLGRAYAVQAGLVVAYAHSYWSARELTAQLRAAMVHTGRSSSRPRASSSRRAACRRRPPSTSSSRSPSTRTVGCATSRPTS